MVWQSVALPRCRASRGRDLQNPQLNFSLPSTRVQGLTSLQPWHPSSWLMQPLRLVFSFDHLTSALFGPSTSLNTPSLADPRCRRFSAPDHTQILLPLPLLPFQNPPALLRARNLLDLRIRNGSALMPGTRQWLPWPQACSQLVVYV
jgi:hypothetical protein